jgi:CBS domain-containing protein
VALNAPALASVDLRGAVRDAMDEIEHVVTTETPLDEVLQMAAEQDLQRVIVVSDALQVVGIVSQCDMLKWCMTRQTVESGEDGFETADSWWKTPIEQLVTRDHPVTVLPDVPLVKAAAVLATNKVSCLPVVGHSGRLQGVLTIGSLLRHVQSKSRETIADEFTFFAPAQSGNPSAPAYIRRLNGELVIPKKWIVDSIHVTDAAQLGYDHTSGRILIRFVEAGQEAESPLEVWSEKEQVVIRAESFVEHFGLSGTARTYSVELSGPARQYLLLTPRSST